MARGLHHGYGFKQIIWYNFDVDMTVQLITEIIEDCEAVGAWIRGLSFDMGNHTFISDVGKSLCI